MAGNSTHYGIVMPLPLISARIRADLRDRLAHRRLSQRAIAAQASRLLDEQWTQSRVHKILTGYVSLHVDDLQVLAHIAGVTLTELVREPGREYVADLTPSELRLLRAVRDNPTTLEPFLALAKPVPITPTRRTIRERMTRHESDFDP